MAGKRASGKGKSGKSGKGGTKRLPGGRLVAPLRQGATRARRLLQRLLGSGRGRLLVAGGALANVIHGRKTPGGRPGGLESLQGMVESLEKHAAGFELAVDFSFLRNRLEALLSVLLEVEDDRLAAEASGPLAEELAAAILRVHALFLVPDALFGRLDAAREDLAPVREAVESGRHDAARAELLARMRRKLVRTSGGPQAAPDEGALRPGAASPELLEKILRWLLRSSARTLDEADLALRGFFRVPGDPPAGGEGSHSWRLLVSGDGPVRWEDLASPGPHEHRETATLARAYAACGNEAYAAEAVERVLGWAARVPPPFDELRAASRAPRALRARQPPGRGGGAPPDGDGGSRLAGAWRPGAAAERLISWAASAPALCRSRAFTPEAAAVLLALVSESAEFLRLSAERATPGEPPSLRQGAALAVTSALFDEFASAGEWRRAAERILADAAGREVLADGCVASRSLAAHERALDALVAGSLALEGGPRARAVARAMAEFESAVLLPGGRFPDEREADPGACEERLATLALARELLGMVDEDASAAPSACSRAFPEGGFFVMRTGGGLRGPQAALSGPSKGGPEADCLLLRLPAAGEVVIASGGARDAALSDEGGGGGGGGDRASGPSRDGEDAANRLSGVVIRGEIASAGGDLAAEASEGPPCDYLRVSDAGESRVREIIFVNRRYWVIGDRLPVDAEGAGAAGEDDGARALEFAVEAEAVHASADGRRLVAEEGGRGLPPGRGVLVALAAPTDTGFRLEKREDGRTVARARASSRGDAGALSPGQAGGVLRFVTLVYPLRGEDPDSVAVEPFVPRSGPEGDGRASSAARGGPPGRGGARRTGRAVGVLVRLPEGEHLVGFPGCEGPEERCDPFPPGARAAALSRSKEAAKAGGGWTTLFEAR